MRVLSWIFFIISILILPVFAVMGALKITDDTMTGMLIMGAIGFVFFGFISHVIIASRRDSGADAFVYYVTFPAFILPFIALCLILLALYILDQIIYACTDKHYVLSFIMQIYETCTGKKNSVKNKNSDKNTAQVYVVMKHGMERELRFFDLREDFDDNSPFYGKKYNYFRDDIGNFWRSYDHNESFIEESRMGVIEWSELLK